MNETFRLKHSILSYTKKLINISKNLRLIWEITHDDALYDELNKIHDIVEDMLKEL